MDALMAETSGRDAATEVVTETDALPFESPYALDPTRGRSAALVLAAESFDRDAAVERVVEQCLSSVFEDRRRDAEFVTRLRASVVQNVRALSLLMAGNSTVVALELDDVLVFARLQAQLRIPQKSMQKSYRVSFLAQWELWCAALRSALEVTQDRVPVSAALDALEDLTAVLLAYQDHVASLVAETYTRDYDALNKSRAHVRRNLVQDVLRGNYDTLSPTDVAILGYPLDAHHVAVFLPGVVEAQATRIVDSIRSAAGVNQTLVYPLTLSDCAVWLGRYEPWRPEVIAQVAAALNRSGVGGAMSSATQGVEGFRQALAQARDTDIVRMAWQGRGEEPSSGFVSFDDVRLEVLLSRDREMAHSFVLSELGPLAQSTTEAVRLRETLEASFRHGSHVAAAGALQLHEHTIRNRLQRAEQLLGHPLAERRTELQVALRLVRILGRPT